MTWQNYRNIFQNRAYRLFWTGFTFSILGDTMTRVALTWFVYETTQSPEALGWLMFFYTGPVIIGGLAAGWLLDRFDRRRVMIFDNLIRGSVMMLIPLLHLTGQLTLIHIYFATAIYGALMMVSLAGSPSLIPSIVPREHLHTANALEILSFTLSSIVGPPIAGWLIGWIGAPNVVIMDAISYLMFALALLQLRHMNPTTPPSHPSQRSIGAALKLFTGNKIILSTTLMFMCANIGIGVINVCLPLLTDRVFNGDAELYGVLLSLMAAGEIISTVAAGAIIFSLPLGTLICLAQIFTGLSLLFLVFTQTIWIAALGLVLFGLFSAPLTIWVQTLRMEIIPEHMRGRTFAIIRTIIQAGSPLGGTFAGLILPIVGMFSTISLAALMIGIPGFVGYNIKTLRIAGSPSNEPIKLPSVDA